MPTGFTLITASHIQDASGELLASGRVTFYPVSSQGAPISAIADPAAGGGPILQSGAVFLVVNGGITTDLFGNAAQVADTTLTSPVNIAYRVTITDASGVDVQGPGYGLVQPSGSTWSLDTYIPYQPLLVTTIIGIQGPPGAPGVNGAPGANGAPGPIAGSVIMDASAVPFTLGISNGELALMPAQPVLIDSITGQLWQVGVATDSGGVRRVSFTVVSSALFPVRNIAYYDAVQERTCTLSMANGEYVITALGALNSLGTGSISEGPAGAINGTNVTYTLTRSPALLFLYRNGVFQTPSADFTLSGNIITYSIPLQAAANGSPAERHFAQYVY